MNNIKNANPNFKTGIKTLSEVQIKNSLPRYDLLLKKVEEVRANAERLKNKVTIDGSFDSLKYDNIFSILGGRGAGKTSVLHTLYHHFNDNSNNILMPVIMPELVDDNDNFIGWILSAMETNLKDLECKIRDIGNRDIATSYNFFERCGFNKNNKLRETFNKLKRAYYARVYSHRNGNWDYSTDFSLVSRVDDESFSLTKKFAEYWNELTYVYNEYICDGSVTPLIFFMIDDADLKPCIVNELIFCIPKYFSHPNVVVFISASPETLNYVVKNHMFQQITGTNFSLGELMNIEKEYNGDVYKQIYQEKSYNKIIGFQDLRYGREYAKITRLTEEILRKLFPVSNRFYLKLYEKFEEKNSLVIEVKNHEDTIADVISRDLNEFATNVLELHEQNQVNKRKMLEKIKKIKHIELIDSFCINNLIFLGNYPRDIVSGYYSLCDMIKELYIILEDFYIQNPHYKLV